MPLMRIAFCHPDLGIGGAERLVVDAALELQSRGHEISLFTAHHDRRHCFLETRNGALPPIRVHGDWLPRHIFGKGHALFASLRCLIVAAAIWCCGIAFDAVFVDQVSTVLPVFKWLLPHMRTLFYCHFPDLLLSKKGGWLKQLYRWPLDALEQWSTGMADLILVNSAFTADVFAKTFPKLHQKGIQPQTLHPAVELPTDGMLSDAADSWRRELSEELIAFLTRPSSFTFLSINRFERKKKIEMALHALQHLQSRALSHCPQLILAGGYDPRLEENVSYLRELSEMVVELGIESSVCFVPSFTDRQKWQLLSATSAVVYTPPNEHFGIVPLESMAFERPVIACNSGGPVESVLHGETGYLAEPRAIAFADCMEQMMKADLTEMGQRGRQHVQNRFSRSRFGERLTEMLTNLTEKKQK